MQPAPQLIAFFCETAMAGSGYLSLLQAGLLAGCRKWNCALLIKSFELHDADLPAQANALASAMPLRGVVLPDPLCDMPELLSVFTAAGLPVVRIAPHCEAQGTLDLGIDNWRAAYDMTAYLIGLGHKRIAFVKGPADHGDANARLAGFLAAMKEADLPVVDKLCVQSRTFDFGSGQSAARELLSVYPLPTAVFACNDEIAMAVLETARQQGLRVPQDCSLAGFDDAPVARSVSPALTTCRQKLEVTGFTAIDFIVNPSVNDGASTRLLEYELVIRQSTVRP